MPKSKIYKISSNNQIDSAKCFYYTKHILIEKGGNFYEKEKSTFIVTCSCHGYITSCRVRQLR